MYQWLPPFFGLTPNHKPQIHEEIFELIYYGQGFTHHDVYSMPTYLRKFYLRNLVKVKKEEKKQIKASQAKSTPTYTSTKPSIQSKFKR